MEILGESKPVFYFRYKGEVNTVRVLELAKERVLELRSGLKGTHPAYCKVRD